MILVISAKTGATETIKAQRMQSLRAEVVATTPRVAAEQTIATLKAVAERRMTAINPTDAIRQTDAIRKIRATQSRRAAHVKAIKIKRIKDKIIPRQAVMSCAGDSLILFLLLYSEKTSQ